MLSLSLTRRCPHTYLHTTQVRERRVNKSFLLPTGPFQDSICGVESEKESKKREGVIQMENKTDTEDPEATFLPHFNPKARLYVVLDWSSYPFDLIPPYVMRYLTSGGRRGGGRFLPLDRRKLGALGAYKEIEWIEDWPIRRGEMDTERERNGESERTKQRLPEGTLGYLPILFFDPFATSSKEMIPLFPPSARDSRERAEDLERAGACSDEVQSLELEVEIQYSTLGWVCFGSVLFGLCCFLCLPASALYLCLRLRYHFVAQSEANYFLLLVSFGFTYFPLVDFHSSRWPKRLNKGWTI